jgi:aldose 1-epimerase
VNGVRVTSRDIGADVTEIELDNGWITVTIWSYGSTLISVEVPDRAGRRHNIVVRLPDLAAYQESRERAYVGSTMGRFARIVSHGLLRLDGREYRLARNAGEHHIHGGPEGFDARNWRARLEQGPGYAQAVLSLRSPDGDQGYPGTLTATATYRLDHRHRLTIGYEAVTDAPTLCGLGPHAFWNPGTAATIDDLELWLSAPYVLEVGSDFVPTGRVLPTAGTLLDFTVPRRLGDVRIDDCVVRMTAPPPGPAGFASAEVARLRAPECGREVVIRSDQSATALYTGDLLPGQPRAGLCLQPGPWPDAPNRPGFPSAVLRPGSVHRSRTTFDLLTDGSYDEGGGIR